MKIEITHCLVSLHSRFMSIKYRSYSRTAACHYCAAVPVKAEHQTDRSPGPPDRACAGPPRRRGGVNCHTEAAACMQAGQGHHTGGRRVHQPDVFCVLVRGREEPELPRVCACVVPACEPRRHERRTQHRGKSAQTRHVGPAGQTGTTARTISYLPATPTGSTHAKGRLNAEDQSISPLVNHQAPTGAARDHTALERRVMVAGAASAAYAKIPYGARPIK
jgi:hypothetical protein